MTTNVPVPSREELVRRAQDLVPLLQKNAVWHEENRRLHDDTLEALGDAGFFKLRVPKRYGGFEVDTATLNAVLVELARGDGAVGWTTSVWNIPGWMVGMFPDAVQDEVYSTPDVRVCGTLSPGGQAVPTDGGYVVNGRWGFISGALHSHWQEIIAIAPTPDGQGMWPVAALVPLSDLQVIDDWYTMGMAGSGSVTTVANDLFVPAERVIPLVSILQGQSHSPASAELPIYRNPLLGVANASSAGTAIGLAEAAMENFLERVGTRKITYTDYAHQAEAPVTHLKVAEARLQIDQAAFHADRITRTADEKAATGAEWSLLERARTRADIGAICRLTKSAVDALSLASGGSSAYSSVPIQRITRDIHVVNLHALMAPDTNNELYGRVLLGLEPNTQYI
ncbi:acyl-CoA dehydrogenase family protein [Amycolatopsis eburnea]|uniref:Acyl-CoA dehydrogenase n=1 Tax=Amycolatopsis eburnea TaxID=2267691 RepID=A0A427T030_9PSEU|nr:acyl-CoA dehydrogenase family protein [Amycolatopsis eburnea]RSD10781.1 acyl-CoA dehydrogenase [Amycolatopsis eburnea]